MITRERQERFVELASPRKGVYAFLSSVLIEPPSAEVVQRVCSEDWRKLLDPLFDTAITFPFQDMKDQADFGELAHETIKQDYEDLFNVPGPKYTTPYEAVFCDERMVGAKRVKGLLYGPSTDDVIRYYHVAGLEVSPEFLELPDHIGLQLHFMAYLCEQEMEAHSNSNLSLPDKIRETQWGFLDRHLAKWVGPFAEKVQENASTSFYQGVALLAKEFVCLDHQTLGEWRKASLH